MIEPLQIALVRTGVANIASVLAAFERLGQRPTLTECPDEIERADAAILPGVGSFGAGVELLRSEGVEDALRARIAANRPTLCVCLGMQLLAGSSEESPGVRGLGALPVAVRRIRGAEALPHFGWNRVEAPRGAALLAAGDAYFAHTFCLDDVAALEADGWSVATTVEGQRFVSAVERGGVLACQFHPELSGAYGSALLGRWIEHAARLKGAPSGALESPGGIA